MFFIFRIFRYAQFRKEYTLEEIKNSPIIHEPLTKLQCSPTSDGAACAILASEEFVRKNKLETKAIEILALEMATDLPSSFKEDCIKMVGFDMSKLAAEKAFRKAGISPRDVQVVELHDCFSANELITYEALGLCEPGKAAEMVNRNDNTYGGKYVVNPSGGLISKGHPLGATGIAQCSELCWQLRGEADKRQVPNVKYALQHNIGLGGAAIVGIYKKGFGVTPTTAVKTDQVSTISNSSLSSTTSQHKSGKFFDEMNAKLKEEGAGYVSKVKAIIGFDITLPNNGKISYIVDLKNGSGLVSVSDGSKNVLNRILSSID
jgi:sterol carrier protein 2